MLQILLNALKNEKVEFIPVRFAPNLATQLHSAMNISRRGAMLLQQLAVVGRNFNQHLSASVRGIGTRNRMIGRDDDFWGPMTWNMQATILRVILSLATVTMRFSGGCRELRNFAGDMVATTPSLATAFTTSIDSP